MRLLMRLLMIVLVSLSVGCTALVRNQALIPASRIATCYGDTQCLEFASNLCALIGGSGSMENAAKPWVASSAQWCAIERACRADTREGYCTAICADLRYELIAQEQRNNDIERHQLHRLGDQIERQNRSYNEWLYPR